MNLGNGIRYTRMVIALVKKFRFITLRVIWQSFQFKSKTGMEQSMTLTSNKLMIHLQEKQEIERLISIIILGLCTAIERGVLSLEEAESYLYSPYTMEQLEKLGVDRKLIDVVHLGTELEDIKSLLPDKLDRSLEEIKIETIEFLKSLNSNSSTPLPRKKWVQV